MSGGGSLADFCHSFREGDPRRIVPAGFLMPGRRSRPTEKLCSIISWSLYKSAKFKTPAGAVFSPDHPPPRRRETYRPSIHMLNFTNEDDNYIKNKHVLGISRTYYLSIQTISPNLVRLPH
jgi:hypothetical protein